MTTILVVDDEYDFLHTIEDVLVDEGYQVVAAQNGRQALQLLEGRGKEELPRVILLDVMMPVMSGPAMLEKLRATEALKAIPVVLMSAVSPGEAAKLADLFLRKPFSLETLIGTVGKFAGVPLK